MNIIIKVIHFLSLFAGEQGQVSIRQSQEMGDSALWGVS